MGATTTVAREYSKKFIQRLSNPKNRGAYFSNDASERGLALVEAKAREIKLYWLVDPDTDVVQNAKFFTYGGPETLVIADALCYMAIGMTVNNVCKLTGEDVDKVLRDNPVVSPVPENQREMFILVDEVLKKVSTTYPSAKAAALIANAAKAGTMKIKRQTFSDAEREWLAMPKDKQLEKIESALDEEIREYLTNEGGGIYVLDIVDGFKVRVRYEGNCTTCASSTGMTLSFIEDSLRTKVFDGLSVEPE